MNKKEFNFLLNMYGKLSGELASREETHKIADYLKNQFNTITVEIDESYKEDDYKKPTDIKHGKGYKKKHKKQIKKKKHKSKKWNRY